MASKPMTKQDAPASPAAIVKGAVEIANTFQHLEKDLGLLRARIDAGDRVEIMGYAVLSAQLFTAELLQHLVKLQITLADEGGE